MKTPRPWPNPKPSLFRNTPPEIVALEQRRRAEAAKRAKGQDAFSDAAAAIAAAAISWPR